MANMTLRLDEDDEKKLEEIMKHYGKATKSKAIIQMIKAHMYEITTKRENVVMAREWENKYKKLVACIRYYEDAKDALRKCLN